MVEAYPLYWPDGWKRTDPNVRAGTSNYSWKGGFAVYRDHLMDELRRLGAKNVILSTNIPLRRDGLPYADAREPQDSGVAVYFEYKRKPMCFACDRFRLVRWNLHAIGLTIEAIRAIERNGASDMMERAFRGFTALPEHASQPWRKVLGMEGPGFISIEVIEARFRELAQKHHPDHGGDSDEFQALVRAREDARRELL